MQPESEMLERFNSHWTPEPFSGCWLWDKQVNNKGYGRVKIGGKRRLAHRVSWELHHGDIPSGIFVCHHCDTPGCVNPQHLFLGTRSDNIRDSISKNRFHRAALKGERNGNSKITEEDVALIRRDTVLSQRQLADQFNVTQAQIWHIKHRTQWKHIN